MKKTVTLLIITLALIIGAALPTLANAPSITVKLRIEGRTENLFYGEITTNNSSNYNILSILMLADSQSDSLTVHGLSHGYVTAINDDEIGVTESTLDTFSLRVNGEYVSFEEAKTFPLENGDEILVYYGDEFGQGMMSPIVDSSKIDQGYLKFTAEVPSEDGEGVTTKNIVGATVTWYCDEVPFTYVTDAQGGFYLDKNALTSGSHKLNIELHNDEGTPMLLRLAPDFTVDVPVGIGDSFAVFILAAVAATSLAAVLLILASLKKKKI